MSKSWTPIAGFEGYYEVHPSGRVRSLDRYVTYARKGGRTSKVFFPGKELTGTLSGPGTKYRKVNLHGASGRKIVAVHRLVATAFLPKPEGKDFVLHCDGNSENNGVDNLRWGTQTDNVHDMMRHGTLRSGGKKVPRHVIEEIKRSTKTLDELSALFGYHPVTISRHRHLPLKPLN